MNHLLASPPGLLASMATFRKGMKAKQVTTHTHDSVPVGAYRQFKDVGHWDFKKIRAGESWEFPLKEDNGPGHFAGTTLTIYPNHPIKSRFKGPYFLFPYLEGNLKVYIDGEVAEPGPDVIEKPVGSPHGAESIECTGVEDYFLSGFYYLTGPFSAPYHGCPVRSQLTGAVTQYRFHEADPYPWNDRIRITVTHGEFDQVDCRMESLAFYYKLAPGK